MYLFQYRRCTWCDPLLALFQSLEKSPGGISFLTYWLSVAKDDMAYENSVAVSLDSRGARNRVPSSGSESYTDRKKSNPS